MARDWPLTGRAEELDLIAVACGRDGRGVVIAGRAGVGKTRLAHEAGERAEGRGAQLRSVIATATARQIPLGVFAAFIVPGSADLAERLATTQAALLAGGPSAGTLIIVDDAHLLDAPSATLVSQLVITRAAKVVLTVRTGEAVPDVIASLWKNGLLPRIEVQPLSRMEAAALVEAVLGGQLDRAAADRLFELSEGNVLYLRQMVEGELDAGRLTLQHGVWRWPGTPLLSPSLAELVSERLGGLPRAVREVTDLLALAEPLTLPVIEGLTSRDSIEEAERWGLLTIEPADGGFAARSAHPLFAEIGRTAMGSLRARRLRARLVSALNPLLGEPADVASVLRVADLMVDADMAPDPVLLTRAAEEAATISDSALVERLSRAAVAAGGGYRAQKLLAFHVSWSGTDPDSADAELALLEELAQTEDERARAVVIRASYLAFVAARPDAADAVLQDADALRRRAPTVAAVSALLAAERCEDGARLQAERVLADPAADDEAVAMASMALATACAAEGRSRELDQVVARGVAAASHAVELASFGVSAAATQVHGLGIAGRVHEAHAVAATWVQRLGGHEPASLFADCMAGDAEVRRGRVAEGVRALRDARSGFERYGDMGGWRYASLVMLTGALAKSGDVAGARDARDDLEAHRHQTFAVFDAERLLALAAVAAAEGALSEAQRLAAEAADIAEQRGHWGHAILAIQDAAGYGRRGLEPRIEALSGRVDGARGPAATAYARAIDSGQGELLRDASTQLEEIGDVLAAADAATWAAEAFDREGLVGSALEARTTVDRLSTLCGGIRTPVMSRVGRGMPLTEREREITALAAQGLTNRAIAERLFVSVRTVEGHLYRVNQKLGTTRREDLTRLV